MSDRQIDLRELEESLGDEYELVRAEVPEYLQGFDEDQFDLVEIPTPAEQTRRLQQAAAQTKDPVQTQEDVLSSYLLSAELDTKPEDIYRVIDVYKQMRAGGGQEKLLPGLGRRFWGSLRAQYAVPYLLRHMFSQDPADLAKAQALMEDMPADEFLWHELPEVTRQEYMKRALEQFTPLPLEQMKEIEIDAWRELMGAARQKREALRLFKTDLAIPTPQYGIVKDLLFSTAETLPQILIGGLFSSLGALPGLLLKREKAAKIGAQLAGRTWMSAVETAFNYYELISEVYRDPDTGEEIRLDPTLAAISSLAFGIFQGQVEFAQWGALAAPLAHFMRSPAYQKSVNAAIRRGMHDGSLRRLIGSIAKRQGKEFAGRYGAEILEEVIQAVSSWLNREAAVELNNRIHGTEFEHRDWRDLLRTSLETAGQAAKGFLLLQLGSSVYGGARAYQAGKRLALVPQVQKTDRESSVPATMDQVLLSGQEDNLVVGFPLEEEPPGAARPAGAVPAEAAPAAGEVITEARALLGRLEELTPERAASMQAQLDAVLQSPEAAPEQLVEAALTAHALEQEVELLERPITPQEVGRLRRTIGEQEYEFEQPPARELGALALRLQTGEVVADPEAEHWVDIAQSRHIRLDEVVETGRLVEGVFLPEERFVEWLARGARPGEAWSAIEKPRVRALLGPLEEGEAGRLLDSIIGAVETGAELSGQGLNLAEIRSLSQFKTRGANRAKAETAFERGGAVPAGVELRRGGKAADYLMGQIQKNPTRWRVIAERFGLFATERLGALEPEDIARLTFTEQVAQAAAGKPAEAAVAELVADVREEIQLARQAGVESAEDFAREMKATELPGEEQPASAYEQAWANVPPPSPQEQAQEFLNGLSREGLELQIRDAIHNPDAPADALKVLVPLYNRIRTEGGLTEDTYADLLRKIAAQPRRYQDALDRCLSAEASEFELNRRYEAGLAARLPKQPGAGLEEFRPLTVNAILKDRADKKLEPVRKRIQQIIRHITKPPSGAVNYDEAMQIVELQATIDTRPGSRLVKTQEYLRHYYETHPEQPSESVEKFLAKRFVGVMTYGELEALDKQVRDLRQVGRTKRTLAILEEKKIVAQAQENIKHEILGKQPYEEMKGVGSVTAEKQMRGKTKRFVQAYSLNMLRLARMLGPTSEKWLTEEVNKTLDGELRAVDKIVEPAKAKMKELGIDARDLARELATKDGVRYTVDQVIHMYVAIKNEDERATLIHGNKVSAEEVRFLIGQLTPQQRAWGDTMLSVFSEENFDRLNKAYIEDKNRASVRVEHYFPIRAREGTYEAINQEIQSDLTTRAGARRGYPARGFLIERMQIADEHRRPMRLGATAIFFEQIEKQEHYITHWKLAKRLQSIFTRDKTVAQTIARTFGREFNKAIATYINEVANPGAFRANELRAPLMDALRHNVTLGALALNINALLNNLTGPMMYLADAGPLHMLSATAQWVAHPKQLFEFVTERDPQVKHVSIDPILSAIRRRYPNQFATFKSTLTEIGMAPLEAIDMWTRLIGWKAVYDKAIAAKMSEQEAVRLAQEATLRTQPSGRLKDLPLMYQDRAAQMFLMFTRQINQIWNMYTADMPMDLKQGKIMHVLGDALALALTGIAIGTIGRKRLPEDPLEWALDLVGQFITSIPFVGNDVLTGLQGYWWSGRGVNLWGFASTLGQQARKRIKKRGDLQDWADSFLIMTPELIRLFGLPGVAVGRTIHLIQTGDPWELIGGRPR